MNWANFWNANLNNANLSNNKANGINLRSASLINTNLKNSYMMGAHLLGTELKGANIEGCRVYGISAWDVKYSESTNQTNLIITPGEDAIITVDNIEIAQFIYLLLNNQKIRDVIDNITSKAVLILGRFKDERLEVLKLIKEELRKRGFLPILFDFEKPISRDLTETIMLLANLSKFIIADITDQASIPQELEAIVPHISIPLRPIILETAREYALFGSLGKYPWVMDLYRYPDSEKLMEHFDDEILNPILTRLDEMD